VTGKPVARVVCVIDTVKVKLLNIETEVKLK